MGHNYLTANHFLPSKAATEGLVLLLTGLNLGAETSYSDGGIRDIP